MEGRGPADAAGCARHQDARSALYLEYSTRSLRWHDKLRHQRDGAQHYSDRNRLATLRRHWFSANPTWMSVKMTPSSCVMTTRARRGGSSRENLVAAQSLLGSKHCRTLLLSRANAGHLSFFRSAGSFHCTAALIVGQRSCSSSVTGVAPVQPSDRRPAKPEQGRSGLTAPHQRRLAVEAKLLPDMGKLLRICEPWVGHHRPKLVQPRLSEKQPRDPGGHVEPYQTSFQQALRGWRQLWLCGLGTAPPSLQLKRAMVEFG